VSAQATELKLASRLDGVSESATLKLNALVQSMKAQGVDVVNLTAGEPDFEVPEAGKQAVTEAVKANRSKYTPAAGIPELRGLIAEKTNRQQPSVAAKTPWKASDVIVTNGGKQAIFNAALALLNPGDEVLIPSPYWLSYPEIAKVAGAVPKFIHAPVERGFKITPEQLRSGLGTGKVKMLIFNSPSNPTGAMYSRAEFAALGEVLRDSPGTWVLSDEIYDRITYGAVEFCSFLDAAPWLRDRTITVNGLSKSGAMTGWRVGWSVAPPVATAGMATLQGQSTSGINALAQWASVAVLKLPESSFDEQGKVYRRRRDLALETLKKAGKIKLFTPEGAFYVFVGVGGALRAGEDSVGFAERLLQEAKVAVVPGTPFGEPASVRLSFATDDKSLQEGCRRIVEYVNKS
jgi:aspartate aminotransferase